MRNLNEITRNRLAEMLKRGDIEAQEAIESVLRESEMQTDFLARLGQGMTSRFESNGRVYLDSPQGKFKLHDNAISQLANKYGIGTRFTRTLMESSNDWKRALIAHNLNEFSLNSGRQRFLMRAIDDEIRGVLSDRYKILDSKELASTFLNGALKRGARFAGGHNSGLNLYLEVVHPDTIMVDTEKNGAQELIFGGRLQTSDFGSGALKMSIFYMKAICLNGMMGTTLLNERHVGEKLPEGFNFKRETHDTYTKAMVLKMRDMTDDLFSEERIANEILKVQNASSVEIDAKKYMERLRKESKLLKSEVEEAETVLIANKPEDGVEGESTLWKLTQAISAIARDKEPVRKRELFELAGELVEEGK